MIVLAAGDSGNNGARVPAVALRVARELPSGGAVLVLEQGDDVERGVPQAGRYGLLTHLDDPWQEPFVWIRSVREGGGRLRSTGTAEPTRGVEKKVAMWYKERCARTGGVPEDRNAGAPAKEKPNHFK